MTIDLDALEKLADEATPGPWTTRTLENFGWNVVHYRNRDRFNIERVSKCAHEENAVFIAAANPAIVKALIAELKEARRLLRESADLTGLCTTPERFSECGTGEIFLRMTAHNARARAFLARNGEGEG